MQSMSVQTAQVSVLSGQIRNGANGIQSEIEQLESAIGKLRAAWSGEAQASYDVAQQKWTKSLSELRSLLERIAGSTEEIAQAYNSSDARNANRFTA